MLKISILSVSNAVFYKEKENNSARVLTELIEKNLDSKVAISRVAPDNMETVIEYMIEMIDRDRSDLLFTTGGTSLSPEDITPEATEHVIDRYVPGMAEEMRRVALKQSRRAMLTRAKVGTRGNTLVINLPGNTEDMELCFRAIADQIPDAIEILQGRSSSIREGQK
ncbi:MAG: MogA/MoaB family molybdenum cofactor biosynthesis protein [Bacillaceae bacterium]|nr:MogA/MoaB family molybdenum cofactor biosynthesis protein [Bacillaceae bacterium]